MTRADEHRHTPMIGRTHGVHAEPMTFGLKLALWYAELQRDLDAPAPRARGRPRRQDFGRRRHLRASAAVDRGRRLPAAGAAAGPGVVAGDSARSPRGAHERARHHRRVAREVRARDSRVAEDGDRRGRGAVREGPEGLVRDAAQAQPDRLRADLRPGAAAAGERDGGDGEHRALARARHLALVGRARDPARQVHRPRSHAAPLHTHRVGHGGVSRIGCSRTSDAAAAWCSPGRCCSSSRRTASRASRPTVGAAQRHALVRREARLQGAAPRRSRHHRRAVEGRDRAGVRPHRPAATCRTQIFERVFQERVGET